MLANLVVLTISMIVIGWWVGRQIETGVIDRTAAQTALYVDSFIDPPLQALSVGSTLTAEGAALLDRLMEDTPLGQQIVAFKIWDTHGRIVYSTNPSLIGQTYPIKDELASAINGEVVSHISDLSDTENLLERGRYTELLETYSPVQASSTNRVIAVAEFYQPVDALRQQIAAARLSSWIVVGAGTLLVYLALTGIVRRGSRTIDRQRAELHAQVDRLTELLAQNEALHVRVSRASAHTTELNERFLRRISAELHDGPAQDLGLALLRIDQVIARNPACADELSTVEASTQHAMQEIRAISSGLGVPQLETLTLADTLARAIKVHQRRTPTLVTMQLEQLPEQVPLPLKITAYRLIQEALSNAARHAPDCPVTVRAATIADELVIEVLDDGPGFDPSAVKVDEADHLGLAGMRERAESLGGRFEVDSAPGHGTRLAAWLPLTITEE
jgi:signal transduction histidine kinase